MKFNYSLFIYFILVVTFLLGGFVQYIGLLSVTQTNIILLSFVVFLICILHKKNNEWYKDISVFYIFIFFVYIVIYFFVNSNSGLSETITYFYYLASFILAIFFGRLLYFFNPLKGHYTHCFKLIKFMYLIQIVVLIIQRVFTQQFIAMASVPIGDVDAFYGTMFIQSDSMLAASVSCIFLISMILRLDVRKIVTLALLGLIIILLGNSNTFKGIYSLILFLSVIRLLLRKFSSNQIPIYIVIFITIVFLVTLNYNTICVMFYDFKDNAIQGYLYNYSYITSNRFAPFGEFFIKDIMITGYGPLTYYNPITKIWLYNSGFSSFYSLYMDYGVFGLVLVFTPLMYNLILMKCDFYIKIMCLMVVVGFCSFNLILTEFGLVSILSLLFTIGNNLEREKNEKSN
jgi:hypothetical protein